MGTGVDAGAGSSADRVVDSGAVSSVGSGADGVCIHEPSALRF